VAAPQVHDGVAPDSDNDGRPQLASLAEVALELAAEVGEAFVAVALHIHAAHPS
jgi:hypothetical protein